MESHQDDLRIGEVDMGRKVAGIGCVQPREEKSLLQGSSRADGGTLFTRMPDDKTRGKGHKGEIPAGYKKNPSL